MLSKIAIALNVLGYIGMQLVWFQGDQTVSAGAPLAFFCLFVAIVLFAGSLVSAAPTSGLLRAAGTFFLLQNIELAICSLPPVALFSFSGMIQRRDTTYAGGVVVLIVVFASFVASYTNGFKAPVVIGQKTIVDRLVSLRGLAFLVASAFLIIASAIQWAWSTQCNANGRDAIRAWYPVTNATLFIIAWIFIFAVVYGDNDTQNISIFLAATLLFSGSADPLFDDKVEWKVQDETSNGNLSFFKRWRAAKGLPFIGVVVLLLSVVATSARKTFAFKSAAVYDIAAFGLAIAGAVCVWSRNPDSADFSSQYGKAWRDYSVAYAIVITALNLVQQFLGIESGSLISTFFAVAVLGTFDNAGSPVSASGYVRGGMQLCQVSVIASVFIKAFPLDQPLASYFKPENTFATFLGGTWVLLSMLNVPRNYSALLIFAIISYKSATSGSADWSRTTFYILAYYGIVQLFPLTSSGLSTNYIFSAVWIASVVYAGKYASAGGSTAPSLDNPNNNAGGAAEASAVAEEREMKANEPNQEPERAADPS